MESLGRFPDPFLEEIAAQPAAIRRAAGALRGQVDPLERLARIAGDPARPGRSAVFTGMGASYAACYAPVTVPVAWTLTLQGETPRDVKKLR